MTKYVNLTVNDVPILTDYFVEGFVDHTTAGMVAALEGVPPIETLEVSINGDSVAITVNGQGLPLNQFASKIVRSTIIGMVSVLKGVGEVKKLKINIKRE
ncbi:MAG: hypothetical protein HYX79_10705 [Chloroflexi bacterium]|nr:hypothetical protein [Chloroflexota bacterium]